MRNKFLGTGESGYRPLRKIATVFSGLRYAVLYDFSVTYKLRHYLDDNAENIFIV